MSGPIDPSAIPGDDLHPDAIEAAADGMTTDANTIRDAGADVVSSWRGLGGCYQAPEAETLFAVMDPVETNARDFADDLAAVATALRTFAADIRPIKTGLANVRADAWDFRDTIASNDEWDYDQDLVDQNTDLVRRVNALQVQLWEAERTCANAIRALYGAAPWHAMTSEDDPLGYGIDEIPTDAEMPWGSEVQRRDHCPKSAAVGVKRFVWDGVVVDGIWGTVTGLGMLVGIDGTGWHWDTMRDSWVGMGSLIGYANGEWSWGNAGNAWLGLGKGLISWDTWSEDPARAAGGAVFNVATILIPAGAAVSGSKGAATAAGTASRVSTWLARGARIVDLTDPVALTIRGARLVLPKIDDLLVGMRGALEGLSTHITVPDIPVTALDDVAVPGLDDLPTTGLDDLPAIHTPDVDLPPVRTPDLDVPKVDVPDVDIPVRAPEPVRVGGGPDTTTVPDAPHTPGTPGGVGQGADDLLPGPRDPNAPGTTTGTDAPTGTHTTPDAPHTGGDAPGGHAPDGGTGDTPGGHVPDTTTPDTTTPGHAPDGGGSGGGAADDVVPGGPADDLAPGGEHPADPTPADPTPVDPTPDHPVDPVDAPTDPPPSTHAPEPERIYSMADGSEHVTRFAPEQIDTAVTAAERIDEALGDPDLFARHGVEPWTRDDLARAVMTPVADLSPAEKAILREIADRMPVPHAGDEIQKVLTPDQVQAVFDNAPDARTLSGSITRIEDSAVLDNVARLQDGLRLDYDDVTFLPHDESAFVLRTELSDDVADVSRFTEMGGTGRTDGWHDPYTGNGFLKSDALIPEFRIERSHNYELLPGSELWEVLKDGTQRLTAVLGDDGWLMVRP